MHSLKNINAIMKQWGWTVPILLFLIAMIVTHLHTDAYWGDEASTLRNIGATPYPPRTLTDLVYHVGLSEWPPAYFLGLLGWGKLVGWAEFSTRLFSLLTSMLTVAFTFRLSRDIFNERTSIISILLLSSSIYFVFYSHELRGYAQYMLLTTSSVYLYWRLIHQPKLSYKTLVAFILAVILLNYTHYLAVFVTVGIGLYHILFARKQHHWRIVFFSFVLIGLAYLPWLGIAVLNVVSVSTWKTDETAQELLSILINNTSNTLWFISVPLLVASLIMYRRKQVLYLWFIIVVTLGSALLVNSISPFIFNPRHLIGVVPLILVLIAFTLTQLPYSHIITGIVVVVWGVSGVMLNSKFPPQLPDSNPALPIQTLHSARNIVNTCTTSEDNTITFLTYENSGWDEHIVVYYLVDKENTRNISIANYMTKLDTSHPPQDTVSYETRYQEFVRNSNRTWVLVAPYAQPKPQLSQAGDLLSETYDYCSQVIDTPYIKGYLYQTESDVSCGLDIVTSTSLADCNQNLLADVFEQEDVSN